MRRDAERGKGRVITSQAILIGGRNLIRQGWSQGADARDVDGRRIHPWSMQARSWSLLGALVAIEGVGRGSIGRLPVHELGVAMVVLGEAANTHSLETWNDDSSRTQASVVAAFDTALGLLARREDVSAGLAAAARATGN